MNIMNISGRINEIQNNIPSFIRTGFNPQRIQELTDYLWNSANQFRWTNFTPSIAIRESVVLLADISPEDRLYLQNEAQRELKSIVTEKRCQINLNLPSNLHDMIDTTQMTITGPPDAVRDSYLSIRELLPITVWFDLKLNPNLQTIILDPNTQPLQDIQKTYEIAICVIPIQTPVIQAMAGQHISIYIRANRVKEENLKSGIEALTQFIKSNNYGNIYPNMQTKIDVPTNRPDVIGRTHSLLDTIGTKTLTQISVQKSATNLMSNVSISGHDFSSVNTARTEINDRFVVELNFDVNAYQSRVLENFGRQLERLGEEFVVHILMKPSLEPNHKTVIIRGTEKEVRKLFEVRQHVVSLIQNPPLTAKPTDPNFMVTP